MKKTLIVLLSCLSLTAFAATAPAAKPAPDGSKMIEKRLDYLQKSVDLTADQRSQLQGIYQDEWKQQAQLRKDTQGKVDKVLTSDQQAKLKQQRQARFEKMKEHHQKWSKRGQQQQAAESK
jgi:Spy/CpxP family protein refolding chaperone